ncbi:MAG: T9SS type A sorting domain-containing protein [Ignavibacteriaceae bacterium]|nr:T9SS type A sorting domain-containing protein [Ignavibacteriaceae bacterium]
MNLHITKRTRKLHIVFSLFVFSSLLIGQVKPFTVLDQNDVNNTMSFPELQKVMGNYWNSQNIQEGYMTIDGEKTKVPNWKLYKRWEYYWEQRINQTTGEYPQTNSVIEYEKYKQSQNKSLHKTSAFSENWVNLGTNTSSGGYAGIGRINCIAFHPTDPNTIWVGSPSGGLWKTTNGGASWTVLNDNQPVLGVSDIIVPSDYATSNTLYIATGDRDGGSMWSLGGGQSADNISIGVLKSTDGGTTWNNTGLSYTKNLGKLVYSLLIHPSNNAILFASTSDGIYKTTNSGSTWVLKSTWVCTKMAFKPGDPTIVYASMYYANGPYFAKSTDTGETWNYLQVSTAGYRTELAVTPADPNVVYLLSTNSGGGLYGVYKSTNSGGAFTRVDDGTKSMLYYNADGSGSNIGQGSYDLCIAVSPADANTVYIGGINTWKTADGGVTWNCVTMWTTSGSVPVVHADKHALAFQNNTTLFQGNDGGIYKTTTGGSSWTDLTNGIVSSQIYRIGVSQTDVNTILTGLQDNGSKKYKGSINTWYDATGGDGMECIVDFNNATSYMYTTYVTGTIYRNANGFSNGTTTTISANIPGGQPTGAWVTPYIMDPTNSAILYAGFDKVWKTTNRGDSWISASQVLSSSVKLRSLAIAPSNTSILYTADQTNMWKTTDGGATDWTAITLPSILNSITYITVKNSDPNDIWITIGGYTDGSKVFESTNGGSTWTNISAGLPNLPVMCLVYYKTATDRNVLFAGTDVGVYVKDGANNWIAYNTGLPNVVVTELEIFYGSSTPRLRAGTFGRGLWETTIESALPVELSEFSGFFKNHSITLNWKTITEENNFGFDIEKALADISNIEQPFSKIGFVQGNGTSNLPREYSFVDNSISSGSKYHYRLKQIDKNNQFNYSKIVEVQSGNIPDRFALYQNYPNPFNPSTIISYALPINCFIKLNIYNTIGELAGEVFKGIQEAGNHEINFNASSLPNGVYFYRIEASTPDGKNNFTSTKKMIVMK